MRAGIVVNVAPEDRRRLEAIVADRSSPQKHVWRCKIIIATADDCGTFEVMRRSGKAKPVVWRWQERFMQEGVDGLLRDKTRPPGKAPLPGGSTDGEHLFSAVGKRTLIGAILGHAAAPYNTNDRQSGFGLKVAELSQTRMVIR